jgi:hypothetical protein
VSAYVQRIEEATQEDAQAQVQEAAPTPEVSPS